MQLCSSFGHLLSETLVHLREEHIKIKGFYSLLLFEENSGGKKSSIEIQVQLTVNQLINQSINQSINCGRSVGQSVGQSVSRSVSLF